MDFTNTEFSLNEYYIGKVRDGASQSFELREAIKESKDDEILVVYREDVHTYYYLVPARHKDQIGGELLELFYSDNYDYTDEMRQDFIENNSQFF